MTVPNSLKSNWCSLHQAVPDGGLQAPEAAAVDSPAVVSVDLVVADFLEAVVPVDPGAVDSLVPVVDQLELATGAPL
ncbi:MAG: hypothetical protein IIB72_07215 [Proteobacteria bacterium]|nr:hypothetical protein [Pseudomonadota bacterium]